MAGRLGMLGYLISAALGGSNTRRMPKILRHKEIDPGGIFTGPGFFALRLLCCCLYCRLALRLDLDSESQAIPSIAHLSTEQQVISG